MKSRQYLPMLVGVLLVGASVIGMTNPDTPLSVSTPSLPAVTESEAEGNDASAPPWASVYVTDALEKNNKTAFYPVKPAGEKLIGNGKLIAYFPAALPEGIQEDLLYTRYPVSRDYLIHLGGGQISVKEEPRFESQTIRALGRYQHIAADGIVQGEQGEKSGSDLWYRVYWGTGDSARTGYVFAPQVTRRGFQFNKMNQSLNRLKAAVDSGSVAHVYNYKNRSGWAPRHNGEDADDFGFLRDQSAPAYYQSETSADFRYLIDGSLVTILGEVGGFYEISSVDFEGIYYVPKKYLPASPRLQTLKKVIVVDRKNQNEAVFEYAEDHWMLRSFQLATTGEKAEFKQETSLGNFMVMEKRSKFLYLGDISKIIEGYAPYALRFNAGAYVHGVPVNYKLIRSKVVVKPAVLDPLGNLIAPEVTRYVVVGQQDPGIQEYLSTIGTTPRSHKCVRNYTSHAKFLYDWAEIGSTAVIVIE